MGVIEKQSIKGTVYAYLGVGVGFITAGILQPNFLTREQNGVLDLLWTWSLLLATLSTLGINNVTNRLFPYFRNPGQKHHRYFGLVLWVTLTGFIVSMIIYLLLRPWIISDSLEQSTLFVRYVDLIVPLTLFTAIYLVVDIYYAALYQSAKGILIKEFLMRLFILIALLLFVYHVLDFPKFVLGYTLALSLPGILISLLLLFDGEFIIRPDFSYLRPKLTHAIISVAGFGIIMTFSNIVVQSIDRIMINSILGLADTGIYGRVFIFGTLVSIASRPVNKISNIVVAQAWKDRQTDTIRRIYSQSTLNQLLFGLLILVGILGNLDNIFRILPDNYASGKWVILFIGLANLFQMASGVSVAVMSTSRHYRLLTFFILLFAGLIVVTNLLLIPRMGISGAALASAISVGCYSLMRFIFLRIKYQMQPYSWRHLAILATGIIAYGVSLLLPDFNHPDHPISTLILDIFLRSALITIIYIGFNRILGLSPDLNKQLNKLWHHSPKSISKGEK